MYQMLREKQKWMVKDAVGFASRLISTPSASLREEKAALMVEKEMQKLGYDKVFRDGAGNVIGIIYGRENQSNVLLTSHLDTIDPTDEKGWTADPYAGNISDGKIFGIGSSDCKGGLAAQIYAGALLKRSLLPMKGNLIVAAVVAEENGLSLGTRYLLSETMPSLSIQPNFAIMGEPTNLGVYLGHDGWMEVDVNLQSTNAFEIEDAVGVIEEQLAEAFAGKEFRQSAIDKSYFKSLNQDKQTVIRYRSKLHSGDNPDQILENIQKRASMATGSTGNIFVDASLKKENHEFYTGKPAAALYFSKAWSSDTYHPLIEKARQSLNASGCQAKFGRWKLNKPGMGTSGGVMLNEFKIPVIGYGPGLEDMAHTPNESVEVDKIKEAVYGTAVMVHGIAGVPVYGWTMDEI